VTAWQPHAGQAGLDLLLVEGHVHAVDANGSPTWFAFDQPKLVHTMPANSTPLTTGIAWSEGGDLVIAYGASWFGVPVEGAGWLSTTEFRCATRWYGGDLRDRLVDREEIFGMDPTVSVLGQGPTLRIYYAYEGRFGLRLAHSDNGGDKFKLDTMFGQPGDHLPAVFAREKNGGVQLDVVYIAAREQGNELYLSRWLDGPTSPREDVRLTKASTEWTTDPPSTATGIWSFGGTMRTTQIAWLGFDAVLQGDEIVAVYDEVTFDGGCYFGGPIGVWMTTASIPGTMPTFSPAVPPPLAPGLTEAVPAVDPEHIHQLRLLRLN
jgi:hypothetical protein